MMGLAALAIGLVAGAGALGNGLVLAGAGLGKLRHRALLSGVVGNYRLLPDGLVMPVALVLPWVELGLGAALVAVPFAGGVWTQVAGAAGAGLLLVFALAMGINLARGRGAIDCGCGRSELRQPLSRALVARNLVLALPLLLAAAGGARVSLQGFDLVSLVVGGVAIALAYHLFNALVALRASPLAATLLPARRQG
jgi:hypothetical protein